MTATAAVDFSEPALVQHYRTHVRPQLLRVRKEGAAAADVEDAFEREAANFRPLRHALYAISAFSLAIHEGVRNYYALQHYEQAIQFLKASDGPRSEVDIASNGTLLTHFLLLVYETAGTEPSWQHHMDMLTGIIAHRRGLLNHEPYGLVVWWAYLVDIALLLSGSGGGALVSRLWHDNAVPTNAQTRTYLGPLAVSGRAGQPWATADGHPMASVRTPLGEAAWELHRVAAFGAAKVGFLARECRQTALKQEGTVTSDQVSSWVQRIVALRDSIAANWAAQVGAGDAVQRLTALALDDSVENTAVDLYDWVRSFPPLPKHRCPSFLFYRPTQAYKVDA